MRIVNKITSNILTTFNNICEEWTIYKYNLKNLPKVEYMEGFMWKRPQDLKAH